MKHLFILNPISFPQPAAQIRVEKEIENCFSSMGGQEYSVHLSQYPRDAIGFIRKLVHAYNSDETVRVYAVGGDGILFDCLNGIVGLPNVELAAVPYGTVNDFVRSFGEGKNALFRDIRLQASSPAVLTDIIRCGNNYALNYCVLGIESNANMNYIRIYSKSSRFIRKFKKFNSFVYSTLIKASGVRAAFNKNNHSQYYSVTVDGEDLSGVYGCINIANGPCYGGNLNAVISAMPDDGILDTIFFRYPGSAKAVSFFWRYIKGEFRRYPECFLLKKLKKIELHSDDPLVVCLDGEVFFDTSLIVEIIPQAVKIVAPGGIAYTGKTASHV